MVNENIIEILLIEDSKEDAEMTLRAIKKINVINNVKVITDGEEAINFIYGKGEYEGRNLPINPKLILLDLKLPKIDGLEILGILKSDNDKKTIPIVVLTSSNEENDIVESYRLGVNSYIVKPVESDNFMKAIQNIGLYWLLLNQPIR
jgi:CheY-like chemotaxis protein